MSVNPRLPAVTAVNLTDTKGGKELEFVVFSGLHIPVVDGSRVYVENAMVSVSLENEKIYFSIQTPL